MEKVTSTEFAAKLGLYLSRASRGEQFMVTSHGRPYVVIGPPPQEEGPSPEK
jgi:prevent-host-death family protein